MAQLRWQFAVTAMALLSSLSLSLLKDKKPAKGKSPAVPVASGGAAAAHVSVGSVGKAGKVLVSRLSGQAAPATGGAAAGRFSWLSAVAPAPTAPAPPARVPGASGHEAIGSLIGYGSDESDGDSTDEAAAAAAAAETQPLDGEELEAAELMPIAHRCGPSAWRLELQELRAAAPSRGRRLRAAFATPGSLGAPCEDPDFLDFAFFAGLAPEPSSSSSALATAAVPVPAALSSRLGRPVAADKVPATVAVPVLAAASPRPGRAASADEVPSAVPVPVLEVASSLPGRAVLAAEASRPVAVRPAPIEAQMLPAQRLAASAAVALTQVARPAEQPVAVPVEALSAEGLAMSSQAARAIATGASAEVAFAPTGAKPSLLVADEEEAQPDAASKPAPKKRPQPKPSPKKMPGSAQAPAPKKRPKVGVGDCSGEVPALSAGEARQQQAEAEEDAAARHAAEERRAAEERWVSSCKTAASAAVGEVPVAKKARSIVVRTVASLPSGVGRAVESAAAAADVASSAAGPGGAVVASGSRDLRSRRGKGDDIREIADTAVAGADHDGTPSSADTPKDRLQSGKARPPKAAASGDTVCGAAGVRRSERDKAAAAGEVETAAAAAPLAVGWLSEGHRCGLCFKCVVEHGGIFCGRHRPCGTVVGCKAAVCWRCMNKTARDSFGKIRTTRAEFISLGASAWWMHEKCMASADLSEYYKDDEDGKKSTPGDESPAIGTIDGNSDEEAKTKKFAWE